MFDEVWFNIQNVGHNLFKLLIRLDFQEKITYYFKNLTALPPKRSHLY
jgi:hypothetical protein